MTGILIRDLGPAKVDYEALAGSAPAQDHADLKQFLSEELPYAWLDAYIAMMPHQHNVQKITVDGFEYLWDLSTSLVNQGLIRLSEASDDRLVAAHGFSRENATPRKDSRLRGRPLGPVDVIDKSGRSSYDKGHAIGHALGGVLDLNIIPQIRPVNRGGTWRRMERYCQGNPGTYFFCRPVYAGLSSHPAEIDFGLLKADSRLWVHTFKNYETLEELEEIERLYHERVQMLEKHGDGV